MDRLFYSTGQVAQQLGVTLATVRLLCENGVIKAEMTPGGQWRVAASEVERLKRDGLPPIPRPLPVEAPPAKIGASAGRAPSLSPASPADHVEAAEALVAITRSMLEKRRIEREFEENEDWFRERKSEQAAAVAVERQKAEAQRAQRQRQLWLQRWAQRALDSVPYAARDEVAIEVHTAVSAALSKVPACEPDSITRRLVDAAVHRVLRPWNRKQDVERALKSAMDRLPWDVRHRSEFAAVKQCIWDALVEAVGKLRQEASYGEMEAAAEQVVKPVIYAYEHKQACERIVAGVYMFNATSDGQEAVKQEVRKALAALPIGTTRTELERAKEVVVKSYEATLAQRKEAARLESEKQAQRRAVEAKVERQLDYVERYLVQEYEFTGGPAEIRQEADRLRPPIRKALMAALLKNPGLSDDEIRATIERFIDAD